MIKVGSDKLVDAIVDALDDYSEEVKEGMQKIATEVAKEGQEALKNTTDAYKIRTGDYNKSWGVSDSSGESWVHKSIHSKKPHWRLTHLLENGHITANGSRTKAYPHIEKVENVVAKEFEERVKKLIKEGK